MNAEERLKLAKKEHLFICAKAAQCNGLTIHNAPCEHFTKHENCYTCHLSCRKVENSICVEVE